MRFEKFKNLMFPRGFSCICCSHEIFEDDKHICDECYNNLAFLKGNLCNRCCEPTGLDFLCNRCSSRELYFEKVVSPFEFDGFVKNAIHGLKYSNKTFYAEFLSEYMAKAYVDHKLTCDIVVPVPLCRKRLKQRGYNQAELLAKGFCKKLNLPLLVNVLVRVKQTPTQVSLNISERLKNMKDAFSVTSNDQIKGKTVLVIDDVFTTGATIAECSKTLLHAGAKRVYAVTAGHTVLKFN
ncbi:MAG: ComF family protein [Clostridia bacterium]|nr:ComF family protein [Clostridia bacterium]